MQIKDLIKLRREELGLTYEALGNIVGVGKSTVRKWETGMIENMRRDNIIALSKALNISPSILMGWEEPQEISTIKDNKNNKLSKKEENLLSNFNKLNDEGKDKVSTYTKDLTEMTKYQKENNISEFPKKVEKQIWEEPGMEYLMPIANHDDDLTNEEKERMNEIINDFLKKKNL